MRSNHKLSKRTAFFKFKEVPGCQIIRFLNEHFNLSSTINSNEFQYHKQLVTKINSPKAVPKIFKILSYHPKNLSNGQ